MDNNSVSFFRKYRPRKVEDLDITPVREFFGRILESGKFAQAYLFTGPKGTGKTSAARILARTINCEKNVESKGRLVEPCGKCGSCVSIENGSSTAVTEIDAASNRGIDDIRALRERVGLMPTEGKYSVFIIDEVHMLTKEAFNALLKTLEEPPKHVIFCLCTTDEHKLPDTVVSRCTRIVYRKANAEEIARSLSRVVTGEEIEVDKDALLAIAQKADGSFRDAVKILEQLADGNKIDLERIEKEVGLSTGGAVLVLYETIRGGEVRKALEKLSIMTNQGVDVVSTAKSLLELCRQEMLTAISKDGKADGRLINFIDVFSKVFSRFADVPIESLPLEMAIVEYCGAVVVTAPSSNSGGQNVEKKVIDEEKNLTNTAQRLSIKKVEQVTTSEPVSTQVDVKVDKELDNEIIVGTVVTSESVKFDVSNSADSDLSLDLVRSKWGIMLTELAGLNHGLVTILKGAQLKDCVGDRLVLGVTYKFHKDQLEQEKYLKLVEAVATKIFGGRVRLVVELSDKRSVSKTDEVVHENIAVVSPEDAALAAAAEEIFG